MSHSVSGSSMPSSSLTSSIGVRPGTRSDPSGRCSTAGSSGSYSSAISPTISSSRSSSVTSPAVLPCSSTTIAMWNFWVRISRSSSATRFCSGTKTAGLTASRTGWSTSPARARRTRSFRYTSPTMLSVPPSHAGSREKPLSIAHSIAASIVCVDFHRDDVGTRQHHLAHDRVAELEDRVDELALLAVRWRPRRRRRRPSCGSLPR